MLKLLIIFPMLMFYYLPCVSSSLHLFMCEISLIFSPTIIYRNQRMTEDQSVVGRRRIYYDQNGGEALICSDSEEEAIDEEEEKREFIDSEDYILRFVYSNSLVVEVVFNCSCVYLALPSTIFQESSLFSLL